MAVFSAMLGEAVKGTSTAFRTSLTFSVGQEPTFIKVKQAEYYVSLGADEIDMVMNVNVEVGMYKKALRLKSSACRLRGYFAQGNH